MNNSDKQAAFLGASLNSQLYTIDLHQAGDLFSALTEFEHGLDRAVVKGVRVCRVIYGMGEGVLAREVLQRLAKNKNCVAWQEEETGGSVIIIL